MAPELPDHFFRREFGRLVSVLAGKLGVHRVELCEDAAQHALLKATLAWPRDGLPSDRGAWLYQVAWRHALTTLRQERRAEDRHERAAELQDGAEREPEPFFEQEVPDEQLRMLFVCADPQLSRDAQLVLAARVLCGFSAAELALRLFESEETVHKRLQRARAALRASPPELQTPALEQLRPRLPAVLQILYLLFNEGYSSAQPDRVIRRELCEEALRLTLLLLEHPVGGEPESEALAALMCLHTARLDARSDGAGGLLLLEEQDRDSWDRELIQRGLAHLQRSARGERFTRYHAEAAIAVEHCLAPTYSATRWDEIVRLYELLGAVEPSPLHVLNRAIALAEWRGPQAGLALLEQLKPPGWLLGYYLWDATLGELHRRCGAHERARQHLERARAAAPTNAERLLLERRLAACR